MAKHSDRVGMFSSHRGKKVRNGMIAVGALGFTLFIANGATAPDPAPTSYEAMSLSNSKPDAPQVEAPIAAPFTVPMALTDADEVETLSKGDADVQQDAKAFQETSEYQQAVVLAQEAAVAYSTYSATSGTADEWVQSIPSLAPQLAAALQAEADAQWPEMSERKESATATAQAQSVKLIRSEDRNTHLVLAVTALQKTSREGVPGEASVSYRVTVERGDDGKWVVVDLR